MRNVGSVHNTNRVGDVRRVDCLGSVFDVGRVDITVIVYGVGIIHAVLDGVHRLLVWRSDAILRM